MSTASTIMGVPACAPAVGLEVGAFAGAGGADWAWLDVCGFAVGLVPWAVEAGGVFDDLGAATGAWLAVCGADVGTTVL